LRKEYQGIEPSSLEFMEKKNRILRCSLKKGRLQGRKKYVKLSKIEPVGFVVFSAVLRNG
jgi:hypothetical protein